MSETSKQKKVALQLTLFGVCTLFGMWASTQWFAHEANYHSMLGSPWVKSDGTSRFQIYAPWAWWSWAKAFYDSAPDVITRTMHGMTAGMLLGIGGVGAVQKKHQPKASPTDHGSSRWATNAEIEARGMTLSVPERRRALKKKGITNYDDTRSVVIGKSPTGKLMYHAGKEHVMAFAPTRSGKGVGLVIPTLLTWDKSVVVFDPKGENYQITAAWRRQFSHVIYFNAADAEGSARFNPLEEIRRGRNAIRDVGNLVEILTEESSSGGGDPFWLRSAQDLIAGAIMYCLYAGKPGHKNLAWVGEALSDSEQLLNDMIGCRIEGEPQISAYINNIGLELEKTAENTRGGIFKQAQTSLRLFKDPILAEVTSSSDFRLRDLMFADHPISLFLVVPPNDMARLQPLMRVLVNQLLSTLTEKLEDPSAGSYNRLLMLLDEFPLMGKMEQVERALAYTAGYGIKFFLITQDLNQLDKVYGKENSVLSNCHLRLAYRCNEEKTAKRLSDFMGQATGQKTQAGESGNKNLFGHLSGVSKSEVTYARPLMTEGEIQQLPDDEMLIIEAGRPPIKGKKVTYYNDPHFMPLFEGQKTPFPTERLTDFPKHTPSVWGHPSPKHHEKATAHTAVPALGDARAAYAPQVSVLDPEASFDEGDTFSAFTPQAPSPKADAFESPFDDDLLPDGFGDDEEAYTLSPLPTPDEDDPYSSSGPVAALDAYDQGPSDLGFGDEAASALDDWPDDDDLLQALPELELPELVLAPQADEPDAPTAVLSAGMLDALRFQLKSAGSSAADQELSACDAPPPAPTAPAPNATTMGLSTERLEQIRALDKARRAAEQDEAQGTDDANQAAPKPDEHEEEDEVTNPARPSSLATKQQQKIQLTGAFDFEAFMREQGERP